MEPETGEAEIEGYLHKRFRSGMVKTLKRKWCVLKDGDIRWYQNKEICQQNAEMYEDYLPVSHVQAVRPTNIHGVELVTQNHVYILVASSEKDQKRWIKAIYESMKDKRPRSLSNSEDESKHSDNKRKRSSTGPKVNFSRILSGFHRKSTSDDQSQVQSLFYVERPSQQPSFAGIGVQADLQNISQCKRVEEGNEGEEKDLVDDVFERQDATSQPSAFVSSRQKKHADKSVKGKRSSNAYQESSKHLGRDHSPGGTEASGNCIHSASDSEEVASSETALDTGVGYDLRPEEDGMHELELMLRKSVLGENGHENSEVFGSEVFGSDVDDDEDNDDLEDYDDDETEDGIINKTKDGISAFEQLQALLQKS